MSAEVGPSGGPYVTITVVGPDCAKREVGVCEAYRTLADNHRLARNQAVSALMAVRRLAAKHLAAFEVSEDDYLNIAPSDAVEAIRAIDLECVEWLTQWGVARNTEP